MKQKLLLRDDAANTYNLQDVPKIRNTSKYIRNC